MATVEFVGLPGSGKSTLHRALVNRATTPETDAAGVLESAERLRRTVDRAFVIVLDALRHPALFLKRLSRTAALRSQMRVGFWAATVNWLFVCAQLRQPSTQRLRLVDQGLFQGLVSFAFRSQTDSIDSRLVAVLEAELASLSDLLIVVRVRATAEAARHRLEHRIDGGSPLDRTAQPDWGAAIAGVERVTAVLQVMTHRFPRLRLLDVQTDAFDVADVDARAAELLERLQRIAGEASAPRP